MERIDKLIKLPVSVNDSYKIIDADGLYILEVGIPYIFTDKDIAITESLCTLINGQSVDGIADIYKRDYTGVATNLDGISESVCKAEKCDAPNCYEGQEPKGCLMEGAHKPVVDVQKMAEEYAARLRQYATNDFHEFTYSYNQIIEAALYGSTLSQSWVSVEERLPPQKSKHEIVSENVLVCRMNDPMAYTHYYHHGNKKWYGYGQSQCTYDVTHWMPMPTSPLNS